MKYFIDTEFLEGPQQEKFPISLFRKQTLPTIDLISIGIVSEEVLTETLHTGRYFAITKGMKSREYYAISKDFNLKEAWNRFQLDQQSGDMRNLFPEGKKVYWIRENVLLPIWRELFFKADLENDIYSNKQADQFFEDVNKGGYDSYFSFKSLKSLISKYGKTNKEIAADIISFTTQYSDDPKEIWDKPEFYAYYADYDWVVFSWIFGKMIDLPDGFPMYCKDLKQIMDEAYFKVGTQSLDKKGWLELLKCHSEFPKQENEHNALADARWNKKLFEFLSSL